MPFRRGNQRRASATSACGPTRPMRISFGAKVSTAPPLASERRGSTPTSPRPNNSPGSGRHSILMLVVILVQSYLWHFFDQERGIEKQVVNVFLADIDRLVAATKERAPEQQIGLHALVAVEFD